MAAIAELEVVLHRLGIAQDATEADDVSRLLNAVSSEFRRRTRRGFEGEPTTYTETHRLTNGLGDITLKRAPVSSITSIERLNFDGTVALTYEAADWRLEDPDLGTLRLWPRSWGGNPHGLGITSTGILYARVVYVVTGEIPLEASQAVEDWVAARWDEREKPGGLASYSTGSDSESYFASLAGQPPHSAAAVMATLFHATGGGVV